MRKKRTKGFVSLLSFSPSLLLFAFSPARDCTRRRLCHLSVCWSALELERATSRLARFFSSSRARLGSYGQFPSTPPLPYITIISQCFAGHSDAVRVLVQIDEQRLVSGGDDGRLCLWNVNEGRLLRVLVGHQGRITSAAFLKGGRLVSAAADHTVKIWDPHSGECIRVSAAPCRAFSCHFVAVGLLLRLFFPCCVQSLARIEFK
jgi:WD40 repeat protein